MRFLKVLFLIVIISLFSVACGSGGGSGGGSDDSDSAGGGGISYTGLTTQVAIDKSNAQDILTGAYEGGGTGSVIGGGVGVIPNVKNGDIDRSRTLVLSHALEEALLRVDIPSKSGGVAYGVVQTEKDSFNGDCGGSASYTINYDDATGNFNGNLTFSNYCSFLSDVSYCFSDTSSTLSGIVSFSGQINPGTLEFEQFRMSFENLTVMSGNDSFTVTGDSTFNVGVSPVTVTMNLLLRDNNTMKVYKVENFNMTFTEGTNYIDVKISGKYYDPDYGYAIISTQRPLRIYDGNCWPSQGILIATGNTSIGGGSTEARLTALSSTTYQLEADTNGDGTYDYDSGTLFWSEL